MEFSITQDEYIKLAIDRYAEDNVHQRLGQFFCNRFNPPKEVEDKLWEMDDLEAEEFIINNIVSQ